MTDTKPVVCQQDRDALDDHGLVDVHDRDDEPEPSQEEAS